MDQNLDAVEDWIGGLIAKLQSAERRKLARAVAVDLRRDNVDRIASQKNPDGSGYTPRKRPPLRSKTGRIKKRAGNMFQKLRRPSYLGVAATELEASVGFANPQVSRIAQVHQQGLRDKVSRQPGSAEVQYPSRILLGFSEDYRERLAELVLKHLQP